MKIKPEELARIIEEETLRVLEEVWMPGQTMDKIAGDLSRLGPLKKPKEEPKKDMGIDVDTSALELEKEVAKKSIELDVLAIRNIKSINDLFKIPTKENQEPVEVIQNYLIKKHGQQAFNTVFKKEITDMFKRIKNK